MCGIGSVENSVGSAEKSIGSVEKIIERYYRETIDWFYIMHKYNIYSITRMYDSFNQENEFYAQIYMRNTSGII